MAYDLKLEKFSGPLELLYRLVKEKKIEISEISLASLTGQYLEYLDRLEEFDLELASDFMVIASELIQIKVRTLLPHKDDDGDDKDKEPSLVNRLKKYQLYKELSYILEDYQQEANRIFTRPDSHQPEPVEGELVDLEVDLTELIAAFKTAISAVKKDEEKPAEEKKREPIKAEEITVEEKREYILNILRERSRGISFPELVENCCNRLEIVVTFLAILELARLCQINIRQDRLFARIELTGDKVVS